MALRYLFIAALASVGMFAFSQRDYVTSAFEWDPNVEPIAIPAFDPAAKAREIATDADAVSKIRVVEPADTRDVELDGLPVGSDVMPIEMGGGKSTLSGVVEGPGGPVPGATVLVERFVGLDSAAVQLVTDAEGKYRLTNAPGGRYRLRAWRAPNLIQLDSAVGFVEEGGRAAFSLPVIAQGGRNVRHGYSGVWMIGEQQSVTVTITQQVVTESGQIGLAGTPNQQVTLVVGGAAIGGGSGFTDGSGAVTFPTQCGAVGPTLASITSGGFVQNVSIPECAPIPTTTTAPPTTAPPAVPPVVPPVPAPAAAGG